MARRQAAIRASDVRKVFRISEREAGLGAAVRSLVRRKARDVPAVEEISFEIEPGEVVGFLGPNGAGKGLLRSSGPGVAVEPGRGSCRGASTASRSPES